MITTTWSAQSNLLLQALMVYTKTMMCRRVYLFRWLSQSQKTFSLASTFAENVEAQHSRMLLDLYQLARLVNKTLTHVQKSMLPALQRHLSLILYVFKAAIKTTAHSLLPSSSKQMRLPSSAAPQITLALLLLVIAPIPSSERQINSPRGTHSMVIQWEGPDIRVMCLFCLSMHQGRLDGVNATSSREMPSDGSSP